MICMPTKGHGYTFQLITFHCFHFSDVKRKVEFPKSREVLKTFPPGPPKLPPELCLLFTPKQFKEFRRRGGGFGQTRPAHHTPSPHCENILENFSLLLKLNQYCFNL